MWGSGRRAVSAFPHFHGTHEMISDVSRLVVVVLQRTSCNPWWPPKMPLKPFKLHGTPNFYPDVFGRFLSGNRIWVPSWPISIRTPNFAYFFFVRYDPGAQFSSFYVSCIIHLRYYVILSLSESGIKINLRHTSLHWQPSFFFRQELSVHLELSCFFHNYFK